MTTTEERQQWRRWSGDSGTMFYQGGAIVTQLLDEVEHLEDELAQMRAQLAIVDDYGDWCVRNDARMSFDEWRVAQPQD